MTGRSWNLGKIVVQVRAIVDAICPQLQACIINQPDWTVLLKVCSPKKYTVYAIGVVETY